MFQPQTAIKYQMNTFITLGMSAMLVKTHIKGLNAPETYSDVKTTLELAIDSDVKYLMG